MLERFLSELHLCSEHWLILLDHPILLRGKQYLLELNLSTERWLTMYAPCPFELHDRQSLYLWSRWLKHDLLSTEWVQLYRDRRYFVPIRLVQQHRIVRWPSWFSPRVQRCWFTASVFKCASSSHGPGRCGQYDIAGHLTHRSVCRYLRWSRRLFRLQALQEETGSSLRVNEQLRQLRRMILVSRC